MLISEVEETEIFKICLEYWNSLAPELYRQREDPFINPSLMVSRQQYSDLPQGRKLYNPILSKVIFICYRNVSGKLVDTFLKESIWTFDLDHMSILHFTKVSNLCKLKGCDNVGIFTKASNRCKLQGCDNVGMFTKASNRCKL